MMIKRDTLPIIEKLIPIFPVQKYNNFATKLNIGYPGKCGCSFTRLNSCTLKANRKLSISSI